VRNHFHYLIGATTVGIGSACLFDNKIVSNSLFSGAIVCDLCSREKMRTKVDDNRLQKVRTIV
jgi:hypothetical protein